MDDSAENNTEGSVSPGQALSPARFALEWSRELEEFISPDERARHHLAAAQKATGCISLGQVGAWDFARTWLRRFADDYVHERLPSPLPPTLLNGARALVTSIIAHQQDDLLALGEPHTIADPMGFVRRSPRAAGALRDLGRSISQLRGSGVLAGEDPDLVSRLAAFDDALRRSSRRASGMVPEHLRLTSRDLIQWVDSEGGYDLPGLIRRLVIETADGVERVHFPAGVGAASGGWDGVVIAPVGNAFVPDGVSGWELSAEKNSNPKAESDFGKRLAGPEGAPPGDTTFVEVICRPWTKATEFVASHRSDGHWRDVRGYNVDDLESWLEQAPATTVWLAEQLGRPVAGIRSADQWWADWLASTRVPISGDVVLAGREKERDQLRERVQSGGTTTIGGDLRLEEVYAFVAASLVTAEPEHAPRPVLLLSNSDEAQKLLSRPGELILVAPDPGLVRNVPLSGHHVIVPIFGSDRTDIVVPPVSSRLVTEALEGQGVSDRDAREFGTLARRSLLALRRRLALKPSLHEPTWAAPGADQLRRRVLLANGWNQVKPGDREALEVLIGLPYAAIEEGLRTLAGGPDDPMVAVIDERWHVVSPMDAWILLGPQLSTADLESFRDHVLAVLMEPDPLADLPEEDRWRASLDGVKRRFSGELTRGAAAALAQLGTVDEVVAVAGGQTGGRVAGSIVWELLDMANRDESASTWKRLSPHLPLLAEAAPDVFMTELRKGIAPASPFAPAVFADAKRDRFGSPPPSPHTHVLWALESLVWSADHFGAAVELLAELSELDPGGEWSNRPADSLASVFRPWHPNTSANVEQRRTTVDRLRRRHPDVAWKLLLSMLPNARGFQMIHQGPKYRDWKVSEPVVTRADYREVVVHASKALFEDAGTSPVRWGQIAKELNDLPPELHGTAIDGLRGLAAEPIAEPEREALWAELRDLIAHHREYSDAGWALPASVLDELEAVAEDLAPASSAPRHAWLFESGFVTLGDVQRRGNYEEYERELAERRKDAVVEILDEGGLDGLVQFATACALPGQVGAAVARARAGELESEFLELLGSPDDAQSNLAFGYFASRFATEGWTWLDGLVEQNDDRSPAVIATLLRASWDPAEAASRADRLGDGVAREFWTNLAYFGLGQDFQGAVMLSRRLIDFDRPVAALDVLALYARQQAHDVSYAEAVLHAFEALMLRPDDPELRQLSAYDVQSLLELLAAHREELGIDRVIRVEWYFLPMLGHDPDARTLHRTLAESPEFFVDVLSMIYRPRSGDEKELPEATDEERAAAQNAYRLLSAWSICPSANESGHIELDQLRAWVSAARALLSERNRVEIGDGQIGQALAAAPSDPDGSRPCKAVRDLLEELQNDRIDRGLELRIFNNRGVTSRSLDEGGTQEWSLAERYRNQAEKFSRRWPRTAVILQRLAETYEADARREDLEAERRRRGLDA